MPGFWIVDAHSVIHRAYHAPMRALTSPDGEPTKATYVFTKAILKLIREKEPEYLVVAMDSHRHNSFRRKLFEGYKAARPETDEALRVQINQCHKIIKALDLCVLRVPGFEADDIIATLVDAVRGECSVSIVSRDKDLHQLLGPGIELVDIVSDDVFTAKDAEAKWGVRIDQLIEYQMLVGDNTDGIPGAKGIGPKTARKLLNKYDTIGAVRLDELTKGEHRGMTTTDFELMRQLVTLRTDTPLDFDVDELEYAGVNKTRVAPIFRVLGFKQWTSWIK